MDDKTSITDITVGEDKTSIIPSTTVGPSCFREDGKQLVRKKSWIPLFRGSKAKQHSSSNETTKQNKNSHKSRDGKNNNDSDPPQHIANANSTPNSPARSSSLPCGTMRKHASANNLQELANMDMSPSLSNDNLEEAGGSISNSVSPYNLSDRPTMRHKHSVSTGNINDLGTKGRMHYSKSTSNLQDLKFGMRRYASALNLLDLDMNEEVDADEEGDDQVLENCDADVAIDDKADQFIAQFYQQMKSQHKTKPTHD
ncbi:hypothetical protein DCAR_0206499 [Daucus carota subsp. sativus]|uniref:Uncharacterized protein n=1 Tax=Daucus carota subsp. sativus TaxID=79200 RepID=A0A166D8R9_DAUCS|nr:hypothetical protein DCAR_0206499 [Daucus carota subsp. sativus]